MNDQQNRTRELTPKLRFPEFRETGEWEQRRLGDIVAFYKGKGISKADIDIYGTVPCIRYGELYTVYGEVIETVFSKTSIPTADLFLSKKNDVIIPSSGETKLDIAKASCVIHDNVALGSDLNVLRSKHDGVFISYYLNGQKKAEIARIAQGDTVVHLYSSQLNFLEIAIPTLEEQQKIADCLSSIDELITLETQRLDTLKTHKKGLMQQLFPAEGETLPKLRFPEFRDAGEWEEKKLGSLVEIFSGDAPSTHKLSSDPCCPYVKVEDMNNCSKYQSISREYAEKSTMSLPVGAVLFPKRGAAIMGNKVRIAEVPFYIDSNMMALFPRKTSRLSQEFLYYLIIIQQLSKIADTSSIPQINNKHIIAHDVVIPSLSEQQKIADCLSSIDELITAQSQKLDTLKTHKKGLMQQLFPALDEVPG